MSRSRFLTILLVCAAIAGVTYLAWDPVRDALIRRETRRVISRYNTVLTGVVADYNPAPLKAIAGPREVQRVTNYLGALRLRDAVLEADLLSLEITDFEATSPTVTATTLERWRYLERDRLSGKQKSRITEEEQRLVYTLLEKGDSLIVSFVEYAPEASGASGR